MAKQPALIEVSSVSKTYGTKVALANISFTFLQGEILGLLGANGAGKTTLISLLQGVAKPSSGFIKLWDNSPNDLSVRAKIGNTPQDDGVPGNLRVLETVKYVAAHYPRPASPVDILEEFELEHIARRQVGELSGGQRRALSLALAFVGNPELVLLDEPTTGLDVETRRRMWDVIRDRNKAGTSVLLTSHHLNEVEELAARVVVLSRGTMVADIKVSSIPSASGEGVVRVVSSDVHEITRLPNAASVHVDDDIVSISTTNSDALIGELFANNIAFSKISIQHSGLEDYFLQLIRDVKHSTERTGARE